MPLLITILPSVCIPSSVVLISNVPPLISIWVTALIPFADTELVLPVVLILKLPLLISTYPFVSSVSFVATIASPNELIVKVPFSIVTESLPFIPLFLASIIYVPLTISNSSLETMPSS